MVSKYKMKCKYNSFEQLASEVHIYFHMFPTLGNVE